MDLPFELYRAICLCFMLEEDSLDAAFARCFLIITWNLMCRPSHTANIQVNDISWEQDTLTIKFSTTKNDHTNHLRRRVYINQTLPEICPHSSLVRYLAMHPTISDGPLFPTEDPYSRFRRIFQRALDEHADEVFRLARENAGNKKEEDRNNNN